MVKMDFVKYTVSSLCGIFLWNLGFVGGGIFLWGSRDQILVIERAAQRKAVLRQQRKTEKGELYMKIAMLTNNYRPFVGGVPISPWNDRHMS